VVYGYFIPTATEEAKQSIKNMNFFLRHGVAESSTVDFLILRIEGSDDAGVGKVGLRDKQGSRRHQPFTQPLAEDSLEWFRVSHLSNVYLCSAINLGADICSYREFFHNKLQATPRPLEHYRHMFFLNCGVRGPFFYPPPPPSLSSTSSNGDQKNEAARVAAAWKLKAGTNRVQMWLEKFTSKLGEDGDGMSLVGPTVSCEVHPHVQSYALAMTSSVYRDFADKAWSGCHEKDKAAVIVDAEVGLSKSVLEAGHRVASFHPQHEGIGNGPGFGGGTLDDWQEAILKGGCPLSNPTTAAVNDAASYPTAVSFVKFGGAVFQEGKLHPDTVRATM
jgi:hypothetical protein